MTTGMARDRSVTLTGSDQVACVLNGNRQYLKVQNNGAAPAYVNFTGPASGGTGPGGVGNSAVAGLTGVITIPPATFIEFGNAGGIVPQNPVVVNGTTAQLLTVIEI